MTSYPPLFNLPVLLIGVAGLIILALISGIRRDKREPYFWLGSGVIVLVLVIGWLPLSTYVRILVYTGGSIEVIYLKSAIADVIALVVIVCILFLIEKYRK